MKYKVGDRVKLRNDLKVGKSYGSIDFLSEMKNWLNQELTITSIDYERNCFTCEESVYYFSIEMIKDYTWEDFEKCPVGTKITFENGKILFKVNENKNDDCFVACSVSTFTRNYNDLKNFKDNWTSGILGKIIKIEEPTYTTVYEPKEQIEEMTIEEVCKALGKQIKIVKEK